MSRFRWIVVALLFAITVINYIDRSAISFAMLRITTEFSLSDDDVGLVLGAFGLGYAVMTFLGGIAVDRWGPRVVLFLAVGLWGLSIGLTGLATGFVVLYLARTLLGLAEGPAFPSITGAIGAWLPRRERARVLSAALIAVPLALALALALAVGGPVATQLIDSVGWRGMFVTLAVLSFLWLPFWWVLFRNSPAR